MFHSLRALQEAHRVLLQRFRESGKPTPKLLTEVEQFLRSGCETGRILHVVSDQVAAQGLLDYWSTILFRENKDGPEALLENFDPGTEPELADGDCPYVGLRSFRSDDERAAFGRESLVHELLELLRDRNFIAVLGATGSGRTSLIQAGLLPALAHGALPGSETWAVYHATPPLKSQVETETGDLTSVTVIDDCDDLFARDREADRRDFSERVLKLADSPGRRRIVILILRADHGDRFARFPELEARIKQGSVRVPGPTAKDIRDAIERPAELVGLKFEDGVVDAIVDQLVGEPAAFALVQFTMLRLWGKRSGNRITWAAVREIGVGRDAVVRATQAFYESLPAERKQLLRPLLVRLSAAQPTAVCWNALTNATEQPAEAASVLEAMAREGLITISTRTDGDQGVRLAHLSLAEQWDTLADWLNEERDQLRRRQRLEARASEWVTRGRPRNTALLSDVEVSDAKQWLESPEGKRIGASKDVRQLVAISDWRQRRNLFYLRSAATAFLMLAIVALIGWALSWYEWGLADQREVDERLQVELTKLALIDREIVRVGNQIDWAQTQASQLRISASRATGDRKIDLEARAQALAEPSPLLKRLTNSRERTIDQITVENTKRWNQLPQAERERIIAEVLRLAPQESDANAGSKLKMLLFATAAIAPSVPKLNQALGNALTQSRLRNSYEPPGASQIWGVAFNPSASRTTLQAAIGDEVGIVRLWNPLADQPTTRNRELRSQTASGIVNGLAFSPDGRLLAAAYRSSGAVLWPLRGDNRDTETCVLGGSGGAYSVAFAPNGKMLAVAASDKAAHLWDLHGPNPECTERPRAFRHNDEVFGVAFSPDGRLLATASGDQTVKLWKIDEPAEPLHTFRTQGPMFAVAFSPMGERLIAAAGADGAAHIWDVATKQEVVELPKQGGTVGQVSFSADGKLVVATAGTDGEAIVSDSHSGNIEYRFRSPSRRPLFGAALSPDSKYLLTGDLDGVARLWVIGRAEVTAAGRDELIRAGRKLNGADMTLNESECDALRNLRIPVFQFADTPWNGAHLLCPLPFLEPPPVTGPR
jgi:WD40 repeat protein